MTLSELIESARGYLEGGSSAELAQHFEIMRERILESYQERQESFDDRRDQLSAPLVTMIERNLATCQGVADQLAAFLEVLRADDRERGGPVLKALQKASDEFRASSEQLGTLATSVPVCPRCGSTGQEALCPDCDLDRLVPDPTLEDADEMEFPVPEEFLAVYEAYGEVLDGEGNLAALANAMQPLEFSLLEAQALTEQAVDENPDDDTQKELLEVLATTLAGLERMNAVRENRLTRELNQGWLEVFKGSVMVGQLLARMGEPPA